MPAGGRPAARPRASSPTFVVLEANPLEDVTNTRRIEAVYLRGEAVDRAALSERRRGGGAQ